MSKKRVENDCSLQKNNVMLIAEELEMEKVRKEFNAAGSRGKKSSAELYRIGYMIVLRLRFFCSSKRLFSELMTHNLKEKVTEKELA